MLENLIQFYYWDTLQWISVQKILTKLFQCSFLKVEPTSKTYVDLTFIFNQISTLKPQWVIDNESVQFYQRYCNFVLSKLKNVDKHMPAQFHFQPNVNVETTLVHQHWIDVIRSTLFQCYFANVEGMSTNACRSAQLSFLTKYQRWNNVDNLWKSASFQRWFNVDVFTE